MKIIVNEIQFSRIVKFINEEVKQGKSSDPWQYKKEGDEYYAAKKGPNPKWILTKGSAKDAIASKIFKSKTTKNKNQDPVKKGSQDVLSKGVKIMSAISSSYVDKFDPYKELNSIYSVPIFKADTDQCAQFVNNFSDAHGWIGDAWLAMCNPTLGSLVYSAFKNISPENKKKMIDLWKKIKAKGGPIEKGALTSQVKTLVGSLVPKTPSVKPQIGDIVGIFWPDSGFHELALYRGKKNENLCGWSPNTHVGIVGAIKDGVPIVFHNVHSQVYADPYNNMVKNAKIAWIKRKSGIKTKIPIPNLFSLNPFKKRVSS
ncbi:MAG: hypothetical protein EBU90_24370 [Proteobacteria bacterium]|nr:hypothetical protein [Pseudomonadota bacterium]